MNVKLIARLQGAILLIEAAAMVPSLVIAVIYGDVTDIHAMASAITLTLAVGLPMRCISKPDNLNTRAKEGLACVGMSWLMMSAFGAIPFMVSDMLPNFVDAFFEAVSGFTTTGATVVTSFSPYPHGVMFWRACIHWIGGMGVLVLTMALLPKLTGHTAHLIRAESPGPTFSKLVPKMGDSAKILYIIYFFLTLIEFIALLIAGLNPYDAAIHAMSTAGTGGFSNYAASVGAFMNPAAEWIITIFMFLFGVNFALFFKVLTKDVKGALKSEELHWYLAFAVLAIGYITWKLIPIYGSFSEALRYSSFQVGSFMSTTGFATADINTWPNSVQMVLVALMFVGSCAGSTAGGMKVVRIALLFKQGGRAIQTTFQPRKIKVLHFEGQAVSPTVLSQVAVFAFVYVTTVVLGAVLISLDECYGFSTNFTSALSCVSNVGPVLGGISDMSGYSAFSKVVMSLLMLCGRLELFPMLVLIHPDLYRKG